LPEEEKVLIGIRALKKLKLLPVNWPANLDFGYLKKEEKVTSVKKDNLNKLNMEKVNQIGMNQNMEKDMLCGPLPARV
jgi:hypothetical protein